MYKNHSVFKDKNTTQDFISRVSKGSLSSVQYMWSNLSDEIDVNGCNSSGETPVMIAAMHNDRRMMDFLLNTCHADSNTTHPLFRLTPYEWTMKKGYSEIANLLQNSNNNTVTRGLG